jgi:hypothetical protein
LTTWVSDSTFLLERPTLAAMTLGDWSPPVLAQRWAFPLSRYRRRSAQPPTVFPSPTQAAPSPAGGGLPRRFWLAAASWPGGAYSQDRLPMPYDKIDSIDKNPQRDVLSILSILS